MLGFQHVEVLVGMLIYRKLGLHWNTWKHITAEMFKILRSLDVVNRPDLFSLTEKSIFEGHRYKVILNHLLKNFVSTRCIEGLELDLSISILESTWYFKSYVMHHIQARAWELKMRLVSIYFMVDMDTSVLQIFTIIREGSLPGWWHK